MQQIPPRAPSSTPPHARPDFSPPYPQSSPDQASTLNSPLHHHLRLLRALNLQSGHRLQHLQLSQQRFQVLIEILGIIHVLHVATSEPVPIPTSA